MGFDVFEDYSILELRDIFKDRDRSVVFEVILGREGLMSGDSVCLGNF